MGRRSRHGKRPANIAADLAAWCRLLGLYDQEDLKDAEPDTLRYRLWALPARLARHARQRVLKISRTCAAGRSPLDAIEVAPPPRAGRC